MQRLNRLNQVASSGIAVILLATAAVSAPARPGADHDPTHGGAAPSSARARRGPSTVVNAAEGRRAAQALAQKRIMPAPASGFRPEQPVTRGELAIILERMVNYLENQGPKRASQSKSPPLVTPRVRAGLKALPQGHRAYPAIRRLALGGYLLSSGSGSVFMPTPRNIDRPVTAQELSIALAGLVSRIAEKRVVLEHPEVLKDQQETVNSPGQSRGINTPPP